MEEIAVAILPSGLDPGEESEDDSRSDATSSKGDWILLKERAMSPMDEMLLKQREMSPIYEKLLKQRAISPEVLKDTKFWRKLDSDDQKPVAVRSDDHFKPQLQDLHRDKKAVHWVAFEYTRNGVKTVYDIRPDIETADVKRLSHGVKLQNCIYPRALVPKKEHEDDDLYTERNWNSVGWALAELNPILRGNRGVLRKAVETVLGVSGIDEGKPALNAKEKKVALLSTKDSRMKYPCSTCAKNQTGCLVLEGAKKCVLCEHYQQECEFMFAEAEPGFVSQSQVISIFP